MVKDFSAELERCFKSLYPGVRVIFHEETGSTNDDAKGLAERGFPEGTAVVAARQRKGRGRQSRAWSSPEGGLFMSVVLRPNPSLPALSALPLVMGLAVAETLREEYGVPAELKWPNDVLVRGRKVAGVLCESSFGPHADCRVVVGIGINANLGPTDLPEGVRETATSLSVETGRAVRIPALAACVYDRVLRRYCAFIREGFEEILPAITRMLVYTGEKVKVITPCGIILGKMLGIDLEGKLILELPDGKRKSISAGDVTLRRA